MNSLLVWQYADLAAFAAKVGAAIAAPGDPDQLAMVQVELADMAELEPAIAA